MGLPFSLALYQFFGPIVARGNRSSGGSGDWAKRQPGELLWLHVPNPGDLDVMLELVHQLSDHDPDLWFLLTADELYKGALPEQCFYAQLPADKQSEMTKFLDHWQPSLLIWTARRLFPIMTHLAADRGIPLLLLDTGAAFDISKKWRFLPGLSRKALRKFTAVLSGDEATSLALIAQGARSEHVRTIGVLERGINPPTCNEAEWSVFTKLLTARPVWLAAGIGLAELGSVLTAHQQSLQRSHRLLLIVVPADGEEVDKFADALDQSKLSFAQRSSGGEPLPNDQVYLADTDGEIGLWYRLAPVTFMGQTLAGHSKSMPNPFDAATLGSVVIHGPKTSSHQVAYDRMARAGASRSVAHMGELALAVEALLAPDRAAAMAHAAWQITSAGAGAMETTIETVLEEIDLSTGSK